MIEALGVKIGYMPKKILIEGVEKVVNYKNCFAFSYFISDFGGYAGRRKTRR